LGGIIGITLTWGIAELVNLMLSHSDSAFRLVMTWGNVFNGLLFSATIGIIAGMIPAYKASRLVPVEAIRS
jgi:putative ABC transport system permease protein